MLRIAVCDDETEFIARISDGKWEKEFHISQKYQPIIRQKCLDSMKSNHSFTA